MTDNVVEGAIDRSRRHHETYQPTCGLGRSGRAGGALMGKEGQGDRRSRDRTAALC